LRKQHRGTGTEGRDGTADGGLAGLAGGGKRGTQRGKNAQAGDKKVGWGQELKIGPTMDPGGKEGIHFEAVMGQG